MIRWNKVWRDLWLDKPRTILVILSITIGVIGVGVVGQAKYFLAKGMENSFSSSNPANVTIMGESFDKNVMSQIEKLANVKMVQAENTIYGKMRLLKDQDDVSDHQQWKSLKLLSVSDFKKIKLNKLYLEQGNWPSDNQDVVLERTAMDFVGAQIGDEIIIQTPNGKEEKFHITGTVLDPIRETSHISGYAYAYTTLETIINRKLANSVNTALIQVSPSVNNKKLLDDLAIKARDILNSNHISVFTIDLVEPNKHWANDIVKSTGTILEIYGLLGLLLGTGLIFNTISAIMISQRRQIGVMKVIGASFMDIILMYMRIVAIVGIIALVWGIPISLWTSRVLIQKSVDLLNFDTDILKPSFKVIILQVWVSLLMPLLVAVFPIFLQGKEPIANAIKGHSFHTFGVSWIDNVLHKFTGLPRPLLLSLRNSFRRKGRLFLTVITLSIGGSMVLSVFSIKYSIQDTVEKTLGYANYDIQYLLPSFDEGKKIEQSLREIKEIKKIDTAIESFSTMVRDDHTKTMELYLLGVNPSTSFNKPTIIKGRWLSDTRTNEIVVNQMLLRNEKNIKIGDFIKLNINGKESNWKVAGFAAIPRRIDFFVSYKAISNLLDRNERINVLQVQIKNEEQVNVSKLGLKIKNQLLSDGFTIESPIMMKDLVKKEESRSEIIVILLFGMTGLICVIAGLGLMGTMSLSVIERKQEIGIMRSIGASNQNIWWILIVEAMIIGFISSCIAAILAFPISKVLSNHIGENLFETPLFFVYPLSGIIYWMIIALILSVIASLLPAWRATRISVKDVLNYE